MIDLQCVYFRDIAPVTGIDFVTMVRVEDVDTSNITQVDVNGTVTKFMVLATRTIAIAIPNEGSFESVSTVRIYRSLAAGTVTEILTADTGRLVEDSTILALRGEDFSSAAEVLVQNQTQPFSVISKSLIYSTIPVNMYLDSLADFTVDVIVSSTRVKRTTFYSYQLGEEMRTVTGAYKATQQFIKMLLTTPGTNAFNPNEPAGNLQNWTAIHIASNSRQALLAKLLLNVQTASALFINAFRDSNVPPEERVTAVEVVDVGFEPSGAIVLSLRLRTMRSQIQLFSLLLNAVKNIATAS